MLQSFGHLAAQRVPCRLLIPFIDRLQRSTADFRSATGNRMAHKMENTTVCGGISLKLSCKNKNQTSRAFSPLKTAGPYITLLEEELVGLEWNTGVTRNKIDKNLKEILRTEYVRKEMTKLQIGFFHLERFGNARTHANTDKIKLPTVGNSQLNTQQTGSKMMQRKPSDTRYWWINTTVAVY